MNILLVSPRFPETFWSFTKVNRIFGKKWVVPPLGLITVASLLPQEWGFRFVDMVGRMITEDDWNFSEIVLISGMQVQEQGIIEVIREAKARGKRVVVGGPWAFHRAEHALASGADVVVRGEAETTVPELLEAINGSDTGTILDVGERPDLQDCPPPRYDLLEMDIYMDMALQFSRGCPFHCDFCDITLMFGRNVRTKTPRQIVAELQTLYDLGWRRNICFADDNLVGNPSKAKAMLRELIPWMEERGYPFDFYTQASVTMAADQELLDLMVKAGFFLVFLGIETTDKESLKNAGKHHNAGVDLNEVCRKINQAGLQIAAGCIIGFDNEHPGADQRLIDFAKNNSIPEMMVSLLHAVPGTTLWDRLEKEGRLLTSDYDDEFGLNTTGMNFKPTRPVDELFRELVSTYETLYAPKAFMERISTHLLEMKSPPVKKRFFLPYFSEVRGIVTILFRQAVTRSYRLTTWRYLLYSALKYPARFRFFLMYLLRAEHYYDYAETVSKHSKQMESS